MELSVSTESELITYISLGLGLALALGRTRARLLHPIEVAEQPRMGREQKRTGDSSYSTEHPVRSTHRLCGKPARPLCWNILRTRHVDRTLRTAI